MITPSRRGSPVLDETAEQELYDAVTDRLTARREALRRRREREAQFAADKQARRTAGLRQRHARKIQRTTDREN